MKRILLHAAAVLALLAPAALSAHPGNADGRASRVHSIGAVAGLAAEADSGALPHPGEPEILKFARTLDLDRLIVPGDPSRARRPFGFASYSLGSWHLLALDSGRCRGSEGCAAGSPMLEWLRQELLLHARTRPCTLAYWDEPRFDWRSPESAAGAAAEAAARRRAVEEKEAADAAAIGAAGPTPEYAAVADGGGMPAPPQPAWGDAVRPLFDLLFEYGVEIVVTGGARNYQRWQPLDPHGRADAGRGIVQFVVGTGDAALEDFGPPPRPGHLAMAQSSSPGVLRLTLRDGAFDFEFLSVPGAPAFIDRGDGIGCH
jgi:hypothetical protein